MTQRTPSVTRILNAAVAHFSHRGYDASSLSDIAEAVGIRKASLYSHFANKDSLFMEVFNDALAYERDIATDCFNAEIPDAPPGMRYCNSLITRYADSAPLRFLVRTGYIPPAALEERINTAYEDYLAQLSDAFIHQLAQQTGNTLSQEETEMYAEVYLGIVDSLQVKLAYTTPEQAMRRLTAMQYVLHNSLQQALQQ